MFQEGEAGWGFRLQTSLQQREPAIWTLKIRYQVKEFSILCMGRGKHLVSLNSFHMHLSYLGTNPVSLFTLRSGRWLLPEFPQFLSSHHWGWQRLLSSSFENPHNIWRPEIIDGCHIYCSLIWQEIFSFHIPHFLYPFICQGAFRLIQCLGYWKQCVC